MGILTGGLWQVGTGICQLFGAENWGDAIFRQMTSDFRQSSSSMEQAKNIPSIQGGSNQNGANQSIPVIIGETYYTPMTIQKSYVCLEPDENNLNDGEDEYFHSTYILGQRDIEVRDINLGIYKITGNNNNISNGTLTIDNDSRFPIEKYKTQLKLNENSFKVVEEDFGNELKNVNGDFVKILPFSARMPKKVQLEFQFSSLVKYNDKNEKENTSVTLGMEYSVDGGNTYKPLEQTGHWGNSNLVTIERVDTENTTSAFYKFTSNQAKVLRYCLVHDFSFDDLQSCCQNGNSCIEIRVWRQSEKNTDTKYQDNVYFTKILTWCVNEKKCFQNGVDSSYNNIWKSFYDVNTFNEKVINEDYFNKITTLEFKIKSGAEVQGTLQALNCIVKAKGKIWNGSTRTWSTDKVVTSNPASMCLMLMQNEWSKKYSYPDSMIDFESFGYLYEYCNYTYSRYVNSKYPSIMNGKQFVVNGVISSQKKLGEYLSLLLGSADSYLVLRGTKYSVFIDTYSMPVMTLNNHNILEASNTKLFKERIHGYKVNFINALNYYQKDTILCVAKKYENIPIDERNILEVEMQFAVDPYRIYDKAMRYIGENELRPEIWNRKVGIDGNLIEIGDMVNIQDDTILSGIGDGAEVIGFEYKNNNKNNLIKIVKTNGKFTITDYRETYVLHYYSKQQKRTHEIPLIFHENGVYSDLEIDDEFSLNSNDIGEGDIVSVAIICGTEMAICFGKKDNGDGTFDLSLVPYRNEIYEVMWTDIIKVQYLRCRK